MTRKRRSGGHYSPSRRRPDEYLCPLCGELIPEKFHSQFGRVFHCTNCRADIVCPIGAPSYIWRDGAEKAVEI